MTCLRVGTQQLIVELGLEPGQSAFWHTLLSLGKLQDVCPWGREPQSRENKPQKIRQSCMPSGVNYPCAWG